MNIHISVRAIIISQGKLLCFRLQPTKADPDKDSFWSTPGGGLDPGEDLLSGLSREMIEETGIAPLIGNLLYVQQFRHKDQELMDFMFEVKNVRDYLAIDLNKTSHGLEEVEEIAFVEPKSAHILPVFLTEVSLEDDLRSGKTRYFNYLSS